MSNIQYHDNSKGPGGEILTLNGLRRAPTLTDDSRVIEPTLESPQRESGCRLDGRSRTSQKHNFLSDARRRRRHGWGDCHYSRRRVLQKKKRKRKRNKKKKCDESDACLNVLSTHKGQSNYLIRQQHDFKVKAALRVSSRVCGQRRNKIWHV